MASKEKMEMKKMIKVKRENFHQLSNLANELGPHPAGNDDKNKWWMFDMSWSPS